MPNSSGPFFDMSQNPNYLARSNQLGSEDIQLDPEHSRQPEDVKNIGLLERFARAKFDQQPFDFGSQSNRTSGSIITTNSSPFDSDIVISRPFVVHKTTQNEECEAKENQTKAEDSMTNLSAYSYRSELDASRFLRLISGRVFNTLNDTYIMPSDENEWGRLNKEHLIFALCWGGLYPIPETVEAVLRTQDSGRRKKILDLGAGTGTWAIEMALKFPNCEVVGVDVAPVPVEPTAVPPNCQFEIDDIELGLTHFYGLCDFIHVRSLSMGLKDFRKAVQDVQRCLRPGGLLIWIEPDYGVFSEDRMAYAPVASDARPNGSWTARYIFEIMRASSSVGQADLSGMETVMDDGFWDDRFFDPAICQTASLFYPVGPWATHDNDYLAQRLKYIGAVACQNMQDGQRSAQVLLQKVGWSAEEISGWVQSSYEEMVSMKPPLQLRVRLAWGRRRAAPDQPAPNLSSNTSLHSAHVTLPAQTAINDRQEGKEDLFPLTLPYPLLYIYNTREEAINEAKLLKASKNGFVPPPLPIAPTSGSESV